MITQMPENPSHIQDIKLAVGQAVRRSLSRHKAVKASAIRKPDMIRRGDRLEAVIRRAGMKIRTSAIAVESGGDRDMVRVKLASNGRVLTGRIMNARQVEVTP